MKNILLILIILIVLYKLYIGCSISEKFYDCKADVQKCIESHEKSNGSISNQELIKCNELCKK